MLMHLPSVAKAGHKLHYALIVMGAALFAAEDVEPQPLAGFRPGAYIGFGRTQSFGRVPSVPEIINGTDHMGRVAGAHERFSRGRALATLDKPQAAVAERGGMAAGAGGRAIKAGWFWWHFVTLFGILCAYFRWPPRLMQSLGDLAAQKWGQGPPLAPILYASH